MVDLSWIKNWLTNESFIGDYSVNIPHVCLSFFFNRAIYLSIGNFPKILSMFSIRLKIREILKCPVLHWAFEEFEAVFFPFW